MYEGPKISSCRHQLSMIRKPQYCISHDATQVFILKGLDEIDIALLTSMCNRNALLYFKVDKGRI